MLGSRRALVYHVNSSLVSRNTYVSTTVTPISHKNQQVEGTTTTTTTTPEESLSKLYNTADQGRLSSEVDSKAATGGSRSRRREEEDNDRKMEKTAEDVEQMIKAAAVGAMETGLKVGKIAKHAMDGMWEIAEKTTESVRDSVADDSGPRRHHRPPQDRNSDSDHSDKFVEDLRRKAGGYDLKYRR